MALTDAEKQEIIDGVLDSDHRIYAIQGVASGDLSIDEGDTLTLVFTPSAVETVSTSLARLTPARAAALDLLASIYAKTQLITSQGQILVNASTQGRLLSPYAYVFAFDKSSGDPATGRAAQITAKWQKDGGARTALTDVKPVEQEDGVYVFDLTDAERTCEIGAYIYPECSDSAIAVRGDPPFYSMIDSLIWAKASLITGSGSVNTLDRIVGNGARIDVTIFIGEQKPVEVPTAINYSAVALEVAFEDANSNRLIASVVDADLDKDTASVVKITPPLKVRQKEQKLRYSIRRVDTKEVVVYGLWDVRDTALL